MPLGKSFNHVVAQKEEKKREFTKLTELDKTDKNTIYNLIFGESKKETKESQ